MICPKCRETTGNDWSQCQGDCPMPFSPYARIQPNPCPPIAADTKQGSMTPNPSTTTDRRSE